MKTENCITQFQFRPYLGNSLYHPLAETAMNILNLNLMINHCIRKFVLSCSVIQADLKSDSIFKDILYLFIYITVST